MLERMSDRELMARFARSGDESAFEALVGRHGPMVLRVCRQMLGDLHDAQDAFQATFLVLACKADSVRRHDSAASWLHGVALRVARTSRKATARRRAHERQCAELKPVESIDEAGPSETYEGLHEEVASLPEKLRLAVVLCYLEGMTAEAAADRLGCPRGTVLSRLSQARERLRLRLIRRGLALPAGFLAACASPATVEAGVSAALTQSVVQSASQVAAGGTVASAAPVGVASLAAPVLKSMLLAKVLAIGSFGLLTLTGVAGIAVLTLGLVGGEAIGTRSRSEQQIRLEAILKEWKASATRIDGSLKIRLTTRYFLEPIPTKGGTALTGRPSMTERTNFVWSQFRKRKTPFVHRFVVLYEFSGDRFRARRYHRDADLPASPDNAEAWDGETWKVRESNAGSDFGVLGKRPDPNGWSKAYGIPYTYMFRDVDYGFSYFELFKQRECTIEEDGHLLKIHAPERDGVPLNLTYFTFWLDPAKGMLPVRLERGIKGKPIEGRADVTLEEIKPGLWAPTRFRAKSYDGNEGTPTYGALVAETDYVVEKATSRFGGTFDKSTFTLTFPAGLRIIDRTEEAPFKKATP
jgi:RNA polymerase sigma factor (sigma-70 family)